MDHTLFEEGLSPASVSLETRYLRAEEPRLELPAPAGGVLEVFMGGTALAKVCSDARMCMSMNTYLFWSEESSIGAGGVVVDPDNVVLGTGTSVRGVVTSVSGMVGSAGRGSGPASSVRQKRIIFSV